MSSGLAAIRRRACLIAPSLIALAASPALAAGQAGYPFTPSAFPTYDLAVKVRQTDRLIQVSGSVLVPAALMSERTVTFALAESASRVQLRYVDGTSAGPLLTPEKVTTIDAPAELRRWSVTLPATVPDSGLRQRRLEFSYEIRDFIGPIFNIASGGSFASGSSTAWYPQIDFGGFRTIGTGTLRFDVESGIIITAGTSDASRRIFTASMPQFFDFVVGPYTVARSRTGRTSVYLLTDHPYSSDFPEKLERSIDALSRVFGPFPKDRFDLVEVPTDAARASGFDGASLEACMLVIGSYFDQPFNSAFFGHEVGHQWWGQLVRRKGASGVYLLDEALAQYGSLSAVEALDGRAAAERYRRRGYPGYYAEYSAATYLARSTAGLDAPLSDLPLRDGFRSRRVANSKGMLAFHVLSRELGRDRFAGFLHQFVSTHAYSRVTIDTFLQGLRVAAGPRAEIVDQWFARTGVPDIQFDWSYRDGAVQLIASQSGQLYDVTVPVRLDFPGGRSRHVSFRIGAAENSQAVSVATRPTSVSFDPAYEILRWTPELHAEARALASYSDADLDLRYGRTEQAITKFRSALEAAPLRDRHGLRFRLERSLGDALESTKPDEALSHYCNALAAPSPPLEQVPEVWQSMAQIHSRAGRGGQARLALGRAARIIVALAPARGQGPARSSPLASVSARDGQPRLIAAWRGGCP